jgi:hypothetical protein
MDLMEIPKNIIEPTWDNLPLHCVGDFLDPVETLIFAQTCTSTRAAVKAVHGGKIPPMKTTYMQELVIDGRIEMVKWVRAQNPPCPADFEKYRLLAKDGAVRAYFQMGLDLIGKCIRGYMADIMALVEQGADLHAKNSLGWTPLHCACSNGHAEVVKVLLEEGADLHAKTNFGDTPLHWACRSVHGAEVAMVLLDKGANVHVKDSDGWTPLHHACSMDLPEVIMVLLEKGANVHVKTSLGRTPLHWACLLQ